MIALFMIRVCVCRSRSTTICLCVCIYAAATLSWSTIDVARTCNILFFLHANKKTKQRKNRQSSVVFHFTAFYMRSSLGRHVLFFFYFYSSAAAPSMRTLFVWLVNFIFHCRVHNINLYFLFLTIQYIWSLDLFISFRWMMCIFASQLQKSPLFESIELTCLFSN